MDPSLARDMGQRFGQDLSHVRIHSGAAAEQSARDVNARAYTVGNNIVFGAGSFAPNTQDGQRLIAHELTHVMQQNDRSPVVQRWAACSEANMSGQDCPPREAQEAQRARAGMVFFSGMRDPDTGRTGSVIANFDIGKSHVKSNLSRTIHWQQFLKLMAKEKSRWSLLGFSDCHEAGEGADSLGAARATAVFQAIPPALRPQINKAEAAPAGACMRPNVTAADRTMNRSVAIVLDVSTVDFSDEESDVIVGKTPQDRLRDCQAGEKVKTFPFRTTRFGGAPIMAHRDGDGIIVKLPVHVLSNSDFKKETSTLPYDTFIKGTRLEKDEVVRVRHYESPHWYSMNLTGDATDDKKTDYCVPAEKMLDFASATNKALALNMALTGVDALTMGTPVGKWVGAGVSKVTAPLVNVAKGGLQKTAIAGMLSLGRAAPSAIGVRETTSLVEKQIGEQAVTRAIAPAIAAPVVEKVETAALQSAVPRVGGSLAADVLPAIGSTGATEIGGSLGKRAVGDFVPEVEAQAAPVGLPKGINTETTEMLTKRRPDLAEALAKNPRAAKALTLCESLCIPEFATPSQVNRIERLLADAEKRGLKLDQDRLKEYFHKSDDVVDLTEAIDEFEGALRNARSGNPADVADEIIEEAELLETRGVSKAKPVDVRLSEAREGNLFDTLEGQKYPHNQIPIRDQAKKIRRLDSYDPTTGEIISRKSLATTNGQIAMADEFTMIDYFQEFALKYPNGAIIADTAAARRMGLSGSTLTGKYILEVPVQKYGIPARIIEEANVRNIKIRDIAGKLYN
jgi:hypothetical protein